MANKIIGKLDHKGYIIHNEWISDGFGGQTLSKIVKNKVWIGILGSNGKEMFQNEAIFNIKTYTVLVRKCDAGCVDEGDRLEIEGKEFNINNVEDYEKNKNFYVMQVSRQIITGD